MERSQACGQAIPAVQPRDEDLEQNSATKEGDTMNKSREIQVKAILARCNWDREQAWTYCVEMANNHPALHDEYQAYAAELLRLELAVGA